MRTILFIVLSISIAQISLAQQDTLIIKLDDYGQITIMTDQLFSKKAKPLNFDEIYSKFHDDFEKIDKSDMQDNAFNIRYVYYDGLVAHKSNMNIEDKKSTSKDIYFEHSKFQTSKSLNYTLSVMLSKHNELEVTVNNITDFDNISEISIDSLYENVRTDILNRDLYKRLAHTVIYKAENNLLDINTFMEKGKRAQDYINLYPSFGMSVINSNIAPEIDFNIDFVLSQKNKPKYKFGINTSFLFLQDENDFFKVYTYNIASLYYHLFVKNNSSHKFSVGYMYRKTGPHFNGNTYTASWQYNMKQIGVKLGGYFTENLEGDYVVIPSIGLNFSF